MQAKLMFDLTGGIPPYIYSDIGGTDRWIWFVLAYLISLAGVCPFVGSLSDLIGRRYVALMGSCLILIGVIVSSTAKSMNPFIGKSEIFSACTLCLPCSLPTPPLQSFPEQCSAAIGTTHYTSTIVFLRVAALDSFFDNSIPLEHALTSLQSWHDPVRCRRRYCRADRSRGHFRTCPNSQAWQIRCSPRFHHHPILPVRSVGSTHRFIRRLEVLWRSCWCMERCRFLRHIILLLPTTSTQLPRTYPETNHQRDRLRWRPLEHHRNDLVPRWLTMGWL